MKYLVAVSGGVDSVVLLDMLARASDHELIVAHFDHGMRPDSAADARFVAGLAKKYALPFTVKREELGKDAGEEAARHRRYAFLRDQASSHGAVIVTAHHKDDMIESIAINLTRGTGWRGLAVFGALDIHRPLLHLTKADIRKYALDHRLEWVEDSTNQTDKYLRNRLRRRIGHLLDQEKEELEGLWKRQSDLTAQIDSEMRQLHQAVRSRYFLMMIEPEVAIELLRFEIKAVTGHSLTLPQTRRALLAIKTARPGTVFQAGNGVILRFTESSFIA